MIIWIDYQVTDKQYVNSDYVVSTFTELMYLMIFIIFVLQDYREKWGTKCAGCGEYVEGDIVTAGEKHAFHPNCFHCQRCRKPLLGQGTKVTLVQGIVSIDHIVNPSNIVVFVFKNSILSLYNREKIPNKCMVEWTMNDLNPENCVTQQEIMKSTLDKRSLTFVFILMTK